MALPVDINAVAKALAHAIGGTHIPVNRDGEFVDWYALVEVPMPAPMLPYHVGLTVKGYGATAGRITATLHTASRCNLDFAKSDLKWPSAGVDGTRPLEDVARDIARRVCNHPDAQPTLAEYAKREDEHRARVAGATAHMAALLVLPNVTDSANYPTTAHGGRVFNRQGAGVYFDANVSASGSVHFNRIGSMSLDQAKRVLAILGEG